MHGQQITIENVRILHAVAAHAQEEIRPRSKQRRIDVT